MKWLSRVPEIFKEAKKIVELPDEKLEWIEVSNGYRMQCFDSQYGGVAQGWVLLHSKQAPPAILCKAQVIVSASN